MSGRETGYYAVLGVPEDASAEAVEAAYPERVQEVHPDRSDAEDATEQFRLLQRAREALTDPTERERYDRLGHDAYVRNSVGPGPASGAERGTGSGASTGTGSGASTGTGSGRSTGSAGTDGRSSRTAGRGNSSGGSRRQSRRRSRTTGRRNDGTGDGTDGPDATDGEGHNDGDARWWEASSAWSA
jgi:DnaJ-class molecular chaperone